MGKQVRFYMTYEDEKEFLQALRLKAPVRLICQVFKDESAMEMPEILPVKKDMSAFMALVNSNCSTRFNYRCVPEHKNYFFDQQNSEAIEFSRSEPRDDNRITDGRLWFQETWYENRESEGRKSEEFCKWANSVLRWIRSHYHKREDWDYVGPHAFKLWQEGKLKLGYSADDIQRGVK
jgi:hypothetical protein